ncbi:hypothetical protein vBAbaMPhT2_230 [Acinetobacter phage vB_AbaM_PhT2]|uniref:Uncharacterized protein n=1 Tax=Acinetobacter phage vB_AbaM_PhT2 TaxID=2690230 RepID=A0A6B9T0S1_9CAUD|nr:hypothetical protein HYQ24_gp208 [Acinetobacter phage vB_AbaM_PhT2]QHJ75833.1 hypothetical protein vBAbaMPhT2_230 [Acinetobacter phage vB_AbaM_PhT2]QQO96308.1 hypothetical protein CPT_Minot_105 [Acinetobacter phage Minot]QQO96556.1 hypothetical protein CPT_Mokit_105 [Acinetobacter phage Mokit]
MEKVFDLTHLLNEEKDFFASETELLEFDPELEFSLNVQDSGLYLTLNQG